MQSPAETEAEVELLAPEEGAFAVVDAAAVRAIGITHQRESFVCLDEAGDPLRPAILWNDQRSAAQCDAMRRRLGLEELVRITGNDAFPGFTAPKLLWVREHEPEAWARARHLLLPKDYVRFKLCGEYALDVNDGAGTVLFDIKARTWSREVAEATSEML